MSSPAESAKGISTEVERDCPEASIISSDDEKGENVEDKTQDSLREEEEECRSLSKNCRITSTPAESTRSSKLSEHTSRYCSTVATSGKRATSVIASKDQSSSTGCSSLRKQPVYRKGGESSTRVSDPGNLPSGRKIDPEANLGESSEITTIREFTSEQSTSISGVLKFCKRRILYPYLRLLGVMGLKPLYSDNDAGMFTLMVCKLYLFLVGVVLLMGYVLQFMTCFRRDHGFSYKDEIENPPSYSSLEDAFSRSSGMDSFSYKKEDKWLLENTICKGNLIYVYVVPSIFHFLSFLYMVHLYWVNDDEHLQNLMERVFIQAAHANVNVFSQKRLIRKLQGLVGIGCIWIVITTSFQVGQVFLKKVNVNFWIEADTTATNALSALLLFSTLWQDAIQITIVVSFGIHCHLICTYTELIRARLLQHSISLTDCMKELGELQQLLRYLNEDLAPGLAPLLLIDGLYGAGSIVYLIQSGQVLPIPSFVSLLIAAAIWVFIVFFPLTQAAKLSTCCRKLKDMGHQLRIRPFGYQFVTQFDLDSFLLFVSSLNLKVKIVKVPITSAIVSIFAMFLSTVVLLWGYFQ